MPISDERTVLGTFWRDSAVEPSLDGRAAPASGEPRREPTLVLGRRPITISAPGEPAFDDDWWFLGSYAFAHHEVDRFEEARRLADRSLKAKPGNAGAAHPLAHVFFETNDHRSGVGFLEPWLATYDRAGPYMCHLSWHLALFELSSVAGG